MINVGDYMKGATVRIPFNASDASGASITLATNGELRAYLNGGTTQITAGLTLSEDFDAATGMHYAVVDTSNAAYTTPGEYDVSVVGAVVDGQPINAWLGRFTLGKGVNVKYTNDTPMAGTGVRTDKFRGNPA